MQVKLAMIADCANITAEGKLNILGIFDRIRVPALPALHPQMQFILRVEAHAVERDRPHSIEIRLHDPDGGRVLQLDGEFVPRGGGPIDTVATSEILTINNLRLTVGGEYLFAVFIDNDLKAEVPLLVEVGEALPGDDDGGDDGGFGDRVGYDDGVGYDGNGDGFDDGEDGEGGFDEEDGALGA